MLEQLKAQIYSLSQKIINRRSELQSGETDTYESLIEKAALKDIITESDKNVIKMVLNQQLERGIDIENFIKRIELLNREVDSGANQFADTNVKDSISANVKESISPNVKKRISANVKERIIANVSTLLALEQDPIKEEQNLKQNKKAEVRRLEMGVEQNPQYFRIDYEICHKLYEMYRRSAVGALKQGQTSSFQQKEHIQSTMNYHKIMQIFKDLNIKLQIAQKLQLLRGIKKFSFNQSYITQQQFSKIFKIVVHSMGFKEVLFKPLIKDKYHSVMEKQQRNNNRRPVMSIKLNKNVGRKMKTEVTSETNNMRSYNNILPTQIISQTIDIYDRRTNLLRKVPNPNKLSIHLNEEDKSLPKPSPNKRRLETQASRYESAASKGYLNRAMQRNKKNKLTWQSLFSMTQDNLNSNISIPDLVNREYKNEDIYL